MASPTDSTRARPGIGATALADAPRFVRDVTVRGVRTRAIEAGSPDAPTVVLLHGLLSNHREFDDVIDALAARFHVIAPDLPGFGDSEKPNPSRYSYEIEAFTGSVADLIAAFRVGRVAVIGHGLGGAIALTLAASFRELVQRLVLVDPLCYPVPPGRRTRALLFPVLGSIAFKQIYGRGLFRSHFRDDVYGPGAVFPLARVDQLYDAFNTPAARESAYAVLKATLDTRPVVARLSRITAPSLVLWGRDDRMFPATSAQRLVRELGGAKLAILDTGHSPHEERPDEFLHIVVPFLEGKR